ncbi:MAG: hypothetical protein ACOX3A_11100 [bacterium]|jgi:hypothetical protein
MVEAKTIPPDITGRLLSEARQILRDAGWSIASVTLTRAPKDQDESEKVLRVARQRLAGDCQVALTVVRDHYEKL